MPTRRDYSAAVGSSSVAPSLADLIALQYNARMLDLSRQSLPARSQIGSLHSRFRGRGMEFTELRAYQQGDDVRDIDWRVTARLQRPHTRVYREERGRPLFLVTDLGLSMRFGSRRSLKSALAAESAALLAWAGLQHGDHVGGLIGAPAQHLEIQARRGRRSVLQLLGELASAAQALLDHGGPEPDRCFSVLTQQAQRLIHPGSLIVLISDFASYEVSDDLALRQLAAHNELLALRITDLLERELPPPGQYAYANANGQDRIRIDSSAASARARYAKDVTQKMQAQQQAFARLRIPVLDLDTAATAVSALLPVFGCRARSSGHA